MMKKLYDCLAVGIVLAAIVTGCAQEQENPEVDITSVRCSISQIDIEEDFATGIVDTLTATKASFSGANFIWSLGDRIGIVPNTGSQIYFAVNDGAGTSTAAFDGGDWAMKSTGTFYAYYPLYPDIFLSKDHVAVSYTGQTQSGNNNNLHTGDYWTLYTAGTTAVGNTLNFSFNHLTSFFKTYVTVPAGTYTKITFTAPSEVFIKEGYFDLSAQTPSIVGTTMTNELTLNLQNVTFADETELTGYLVLAPVDITGIPITVKVYKDGVAAYEYTLTKASPMVPAKTYAFRATALTQLAASAVQANALFASGATAVTITEPLTDDATVVLPDTGEAVTLTLPTTASSSKLTVSYDPGASSYPATLAITGPEGADLDIQTPNSTVTVNGVSYDHVTSRTAANTCIIPAGVTVTTLKVIQGGVQVYGTVSQIDLSEQEDDAIINVSGTVTSLLGEDDNEYTPATGVSLNQSSINLNVGATETLTATVAPTGAYPKVTWTSSDETIAAVSSTGVVTAVAAGSATITVKTISGGFTATCTVTVLSIPIPVAVNLGLPSGIKWASFNLGATAPEGFGDYYAWGETEPYYSSQNPLTWKDGKTGYNWASYKWCDGGGESFTKYNISSSYGPVDNKMALDPEDDVAHVKLGGGWRMPTDAEWEELIGNCATTWVEDYNGTGIKGNLVTSNQNGNSIFLPAAGCISNTALNYVGSRGLYWSSSLHTENPPLAYFLYLFFAGANKNNSQRYSGFSVRPVYDESVHPASISLNKSSMSLSAGKSEQLTPTVYPTMAINKNVTWFSSNTNVATVDADGVVSAIAAGYTTITVETVDGGVTATCKVIVQSASIPLFVDLGLPSGIKWATRNLCEAGFVEYPEDHGDYYAWGETTPYYSSQNPLTWKDGKTSGYNWASYSLCNGGETSLTKYNYSNANGTVDNKMILDPEDDVAHVKLGGNWRMPTDAEMTELIENCTCTWTTHNGVKGVLVTATNGNSIFLPAAGRRHNTDSTNAGDFGIYWSSSLHTDYPYRAYDLYFYSGYSDNVLRDSYLRSDGHSVRPVSE